MRRYNDYELIYMYRCCNSEQALNILIHKYKPLMYKTIYRYGTKTNDYDDYLQEATITLYKALVTYKEHFNKTFTRYYELLLRRRIIYLRYKTPKYELHENFEVYADYIEEEIYIGKLTNSEEEVFERYFIQNQNIDFISKSVGKSKKQIYNTIYRIREKYRSYNNLK